MDIYKNGLRTAGYSYLHEMLGIETMPLWHVSMVTPIGAHRLNVEDGRIEEIYPAKYWPGDQIGSHLEFALKYDGVVLRSLYQIFKTLSEPQITSYINSKPTGKYARRIWFLYELLTGVTLPITDATVGNYVNALEPDMYYTIEKGKKSKRHRVVDNLLGPTSFCPIVRRTARLSDMDSSAVRKECENVAASYPPDLLKRALGYLYSKETKSSFEIENIRPSALRTERYVALLESAESEDYCTKNLLIGLQNRIVDPRFQDSEYRNNQNYIGQTLSLGKEIVHYVSPKPDDIQTLMQGLLEAHTRMKTGGVSAIVHAAVIAYGFVFLHPFEDGNGRIHRFLIHNILSIRGLVPKGLMFPVSAAMVKARSDYDASLEAFSKPLMSLVDYTLDDIGRMTVEGNTRHLYAYMDMTSQTEALQNFIELTIHNELVDELSFLQRYDKAKAAIQDIVDMPDRLIDLFIHLCIQNNGRLSEKKKSTHFDFLSKSEISEIEKAIQVQYNG